MADFETFDLDGVIVRDAFGTMTPRVRRSMRRGLYEQAERQAAAQVLREGDKVLELGGGLGVISTVAAQRIGAANVTSVEANPALIEQIRDTHAQNDASEIELVHAVAMHYEGEATFYISHHMWASSLSPDTPNLMDTVKVPVVDVNKLVRRRGCNVLFADIEGGEFPLIQSLDLAPLDLLMIELHPNAANRADVGQFFSTLLAAGFEPALDMWPSRDVVIFQRTALRG